MPFSPSMAAAAAAGGGSPLTWAALGLTGLSAASSLLGSKDDGGFTPSPQDIRGSGFRLAFDPTSGPGSATFGVQRRAVLPTIGSLQAALADLEGVGDSEHINIPDTLQGLITSPRGFVLAGELRGFLQNALSLMERGITPTFDPGLDSLLGQIETVRGQFTRGQLVEAVTKALEREQERARGDLKTQLSRRRVLGSSFAADVQTRQDLAFEELKDQFRTKATFEELAIAQQLLDTEFQVRQVSINRQISEMQLAAGFATDLTSINTGAQQFQQELAAKEQTGTGQALGALAGGLFSFGEAQRESEQNELDRLQMQAFLTRRFGQ